jgi:hypothetical protein
LNKNEKNANVPSFCTNHNHNAPWEGRNPVLWHWIFAAEKLVFIQKHKKKANITLFVHQFDRK